MVTRCVFSPAILYASRNRIIICFYQVKGFEKGNFIKPTILTNITPSMQCYKEEIFGPVMVCVFVDTLEQAITLTNANPYANMIRNFNINIFIV